jgi:hypothetical protein
VWRFETALRRGTLMNRTASHAFWLLAAVTGLGCGDEGAVRSDERAPVSPDLISNAEAPVSGDVGDVSPEVALPEPDAPQPTGGQSGTDSEGGGDPCVGVVPMPLASDAVQGGELVSGRIARASRRHALTGSLLGEPVTLELELEPGDGVPMHQLYGACDEVQVPVRMSATTVPANGNDVLHVEAREGLLMLRPTWGYGEMKLEEADFSNSGRLRGALLGSIPAGTADVYVQGNVVVYFEFDVQPPAGDELAPHFASLYYSASFGSLNGSFEERYSPAPPPSTP